MPTASTSQILGNNESTEPFTSNVFSRRVLSGEFQIVNPYLLEDLTKLDLWSDSLKTAIVLNQGSIQHIDGIPEEIKPLYKTVWEISQKKIIDMAADRGPFIDQSQSLNLHLAQPNYGKITSMHFYSWRKVCCPKKLFMLDIHHLFVFYYLLLISFCLLPGYSLVCLEYVGDIVLFGEGADKIQSLLNTLNKSLGIFDLSFQM